MSDKVQAIIFDLGNTLMYFDGDFIPIAQQGAQDMAAFFSDKKIKVDKTALAETFLAHRLAAFESASISGLEVTCEQSLQAALEQLDVEPAAFNWVPEAVRRYFAPEEAAWTAYEGSKPALKQLHRHYRMGILSNATDDGLIQRLVNRLEFRPWLAPVLSSAELGLRKPRREAFEAVLSAWDLPPEAVVMVGDRLDADIQGAHNLGMRAILITTDEPDYNADLRTSIVPEATIAAIDELPAVLKQWAGH